MSGHSKWSTIKHKKAAADAKRGQSFTRIIREITVAARSGGSDVDANPRLRSAVLAAKAVNMPQDNIKRAMQRGTGELPGITYEEIAYEGYGPEGVALFIEAMTDNSNRTTPEIRHMFGKHGGNLGAPNCVAWMFDKKGFFSVDRSAIAEDKLMEVVLEAGAEDILEVDDTFEITTPVEAFEAVRAAMEEASIKAEVAEIARIPGTLVKVAGKKAAQLVRLLEALEEHDDVQKVWANADIQEGGGGQD